MNFLAHLYLSGNDNKVITGNFIADHVKGKKYLEYPKKISEGIILHRKIDSFTDEHPLFREVKKLFRNEFGLYSGVVTDLIFDHFLASGWKNYHQLTLRQFAKKVHAVLLANIFYLPSRVQGFLPAIIKSRRLESYAQVSGIRQSMDIMSRHTSLPSKADLATGILLENYDFIGNHFSEFMEEIISFVEVESGIVIERPAVLRS